MKFKVNKIQARHLSPLSPKRATPAVQSYTSSAPALLPSPHTSTPGQQPSELPLDLQEGQKEIESEREVTETLPAFLQTQKTCFEKAKSKMKLAKIA